MSAKRRPDTDLNHDNWADEQAPEEVGEFQKADEAELKKRLIKKAKRSIHRADNTDTDGGAIEAPRSTVFSGFSAFASSKPTFNFGTFSTKVAQGSSVLPASASQFSFTAPSNNVASSKELEKSTHFCMKLMELNKAVIDCVQGHIDSGKLCVLTPIFNDYIKYAKALEDEEQKKPAAEDAKSTSVPTFSFANPSNNNDKSGETKSLSAASTISLSKSDNPTSFLFGKPTCASTAGTGLFANVNKPFESKPDTSSATASNEQTDADADEEPPKVEFTPVVESESMYSKRCKIFVKVANEFSSRGTGTLYLKNVPDNNKVQLIVRADTNLGNILLNILLVDGLPVQKMGKNNVMIVCIPTPESEPKPTTVLIRVKNENEAEELLAEIKKHLK